MKKEIKTLSTPKLELKNLADIQPLTANQAAELKGGIYYCCTDKRRPIKVRYRYY